MPFSLRHCLDNLQGLLQNEAFGGAEDKVGFFGRCMLHGMVSDAVSKETEDKKTAFQCQNDDHNSTCARTEVSSLLFLFIYFTVIVYPQYMRSFVLGREGTCEEEKHRLAHLGYHKKKLLLGSV